jgi:hypothetical protein
MTPNKSSIENSLVVSATVTIQLNLDGTWKVIGFNSDDKNQTKLTSFEYKPVNNNHGMFNERKIRAKETRKRSKRKSSHCAKCGMQGKNVLTCLSVRLEDGTCESQHHRRTQHDKRSYNNAL